NGLILGKLGAVIAVVVIQFALVFAVAVCLGFRGPVDVLGLVLATVFGTACLLSLGLLMAGTLRAEATLAATHLIWVLLAGVGGIDMKAIIVLLIWGLVGTLAARRWFRFE